MKKVGEKCHGSLSIDKFNFHEKKNIWFNKSKKCINEKVKCKMC